MRPTLSLIKREFTAYFLSPIAYVVLAVFLLVTGHLFYLTLNLLTETGPRGVEFPMQTMLGDEKFWLVFLFIPPLLTMRLFAEERGTGTLEMLMTAPVRDWQVVFAKFTACFLFYLVLWLPTLIYWPVLADLHIKSLEQPSDHAIALNYVVAIALGVLLAVPLIAGVVNIVVGRTASGVWWLLAWLVLAGGLFAACWFVFPEFGVPMIKSGVFPYLIKNVEFSMGIDPRPIGTSYIGVILAGAMFLSLGLFVSSLVRSQMVAALVSLLLSLLFIVAGFWRPDMDPSSLIYRIIYYVSVPMHFSRDFTRGILDVGHLVLYVSMTLFFLFMTVRSLESRRWK